LASLEQTRLSAAMICPNGTRPLDYTIPKTTISVKSGFSLGNFGSKSIIIRHGQLYFRVKMAEKNMIGI